LTVAARTLSGLEIEVDIGSPSWAAAEPLDPGTARVVRDGFGALYDRDGLLRRFATFVAAQ
jgi:uncharacterized protein